MRPSLTGAQSELRSSKDRACNPTASPALLFGLQPGVLPRPLPLGSQGRPSPARTFQGQGGENGVVGGRTPHVLQYLLHRGGAPGGWAAPLASWLWNPSLEAKKRALTGASTSRPFPGLFLPPSELLHTRRSPVPGEACPAPPLRARFASGSPNDRQHGARGFGARLHLCLSFPVKDS